MNEFNSSVYQAWCGGRCAGNNHIPYANALLASTVDRNVDNDANSQIRVDDDTTRATIQKEFDESQVIQNTIAARLVTGTGNNARSEAELSKDILDELTTTYDRLVDVNTKLDTLDRLITALDTISGKLDTIIANTTKTEATDDTNV